MDENLGLMNEPWMAIGGIILLMAGMLAFIGYLKHGEEWKVQRDIKKLKRDLRRE